MIGRIRVTQAGEIFMINMNKNISEKDRNILLVLDTIAELGEASSGNIVRKAWLSPATVSRAINRLKNIGLVEIEEREIESAGRRPEIYRINPDYGYLMLYEMRAKEINAYFADLVGEIKAEIQVPVEQDVSMEELMELLKQAYTSLLDAAKVDSARVLAAGISVPGVVNEENMRIERIPDIYRFRDANVYESIMNVLSIPVIINNVSRLALVGEKIKCYPDCKDMALLSFTNYYGVGGIIINNELCKGKRYAAGEVGDMFFDKSNFNTDYCGNMGCLESHAGLQVMYDRIQALMDKGRAGILKGIMERRETKKLTLGLVEEAVAKRDFDVADIFYDTMKIWSSGIINIFSIIDPEVVVIGGSVNSENTLALEAVKHFVSKGVYYEPDIRLSKLGNKAQLYGGLHELRKYVFSELLTEVVRQQKH